MAANKNLLKANTTVRANFARRNKTLSWLLLLNHERPGTGNSPYKLMSGIDEVLQSSRQQ